MKWLDALRHTEKTRARSQKVKGYDPDPQTQKTSNPSQKAKGPDPDLNNQCLYDVTAALTVGRPTPTVAQQISEALYDLRAVVAACRHDSMRDHIMSVLRLGTNGEAGVMFAVRELARNFIEVVVKDGSRSAAEAEHEFERMVNGAGHRLDAGGTGASVAAMWPTPAAPREVARRVIAGYAQRPLVNYAQDFHQWDGTCYRMLSETHLRSDLYLLLEDAHHWVKVRGGGFEAVPWRPDAAKIGKVIDAMKVRPVLLSSDVRPSRWVTDQGELAAAGEQVIACGNGLLRVKDRTLLASSPRFFNTFALPFGYDANARCDRWLRFVEEILPGDQEARDLLQEWFGYIVSGSTKLHKALMVIGRTRSGKGTIDRVIAALVGAMNHAGLSGADLTAPFGLEDLIPKTVATFSDERMTMNGKRFVEIILRITGEDPVTANRKNRKVWNGQLGTRLQLMSNEFPVLPDNSGAVIGRFLVLYLSESFYGREEIGLDAKLFAELPGILNWALDGLDRPTRTRDSPQSPAARTTSTRCVRRPVRRTFLSRRCAASAPASTWGAPTLSPCGSPGARPTTTTPAPRTT